MTMQEEKDQIESNIMHIMHILSQTPDEHPSMPSLLAALGSEYEDRFDLSNEPSDIDKAIENGRIALSMTPDGDSDQLTLLRLLGRSHKKQFQRTGAADDIEKAIEFESITLALTPEGDPGLPLRLMDLGVSHYLRYQRLGELTDLQKAFECQTRALALIPEGHPELTTSLSNQGEYYRERYVRLGALDDLERAIEYNSRAVALSTESDPGLLAQLSNLGVSHRRRYECLGEQVDLEKAIECITRAVALTPDGNPDLPKRISNLGGCHMNRYGRVGEMSDLDKAVECYTRAVALIPESDPDLLGHLSNLGISHINRYQRMAEVGDLDLAIECLTRAATSSPNDHPHLPLCLSNLGVAHKQRYSRLGEPRDLDKAIECETRGLALLPDGHPHLSKSHCNYALSYLTLYQHSSDPSHLQISLYSFRFASQGRIGSPRAKFDYACSWAKYAAVFYSLEPIEAYQTAITLLPQFAWLGATTHQRYQDLATARTLAVDAACIAIRFLRYSLALEWLEQARCVVWNQSLMLRTPLDQLQSGHPTLAARLHTVAEQLHAASSQSRESQTLSSGSSSAEHAAQQHSRLAMEYDELIAQAQELPGFASFLRPVDSAELISAAQYGPVVVINCHDDRCDALIILPGQDWIQHIHLPNFTGKDAQTARSYLQKSIRSKGLRERGVKHKQQTGQVDSFGSVLAGLWYKVVKPILDFLGYTNNVRPNSLPHITWCPTGAMSFLPLHAAGDYDQPQSRVYDYVISSYTPTITALLSSNPTTLASDTQVLAICQEATPGHSPLPGTARELECIQAHVQNTAQYTQLSNGQATTSGVLDAMEQHDWVHLACHAHQNVNDATKSGFFLHDGTLDLAAINRRSLKNKGLAFLSACQTAKGDEELPDEAIHLASGMLMAGYSSVIGTMWSVYDADALRVADKVYEQLMQDRKLGSGEAGKALHNAVAKLRDEVGEKAFERWVPYIHIGS